MQIWSRSRGASAAAGRLSRERAIVRAASAEPPAAGLFHTRRMPLEEYRRKRDFARTPEPGGAQGSDARPGAGRRFVVQKHRARRLHYDLRLEIDGVLASWAVPKGPTLDPGVRRMAVHVEDHPIEYFDFEGVIPPNQYGSGDVIVWDWGTWEPEAETSDPAAAVAAGELKFVLHGEKLRGRFTLVRTSGPEQWLLIHKHDDHAVAGWDAADHPRSVRSGRTNDEVKADVPAVWVSGAPLDQAEIDLSGATRRDLPTFIEPMPAMLVSSAPVGDDWLVEVKWDGFRVETIVDSGSVTLRTRKNNDASGYFPGLLSPPTWIDAHEAIVDGEVVAPDESGRPDFSLLQQRISTYRATGGEGLVYQAFDLLHLDGRSLLDVPLEERRKLLRLVLRPNARVRYADHVVGQGPAFLAACAEQGLEGIVAKRRRSRYEPGRRTGAWVKVKVRPEQEFVVGGWTPQREGPRRVGALVLGVYEGEHLRYAGKVGSGIDGRTAAALLDAMAPLHVDEPPFDPAPPRNSRNRWGGSLADVTWVRPEIVVRVQLGGWSRDGLVRQASFCGIETGRDPRDVVREVAVAVPSAPPDPAPPAAPELPGGGGRPQAVTAAELEALATLGTDGVWEVGGQQLKLTNLDKGLFEAAPGSTEAPITKREVIRYFAEVAPFMLPHLDGRPLNLHRFPNGAGNKGFWQKDIPASAPRWLTRWHETVLAEREDRAANVHLLADGVATLAWLGNQAAFEVHAWTSTCDDPWRPTFALIDIDPGTSTTWDETVVLARLYRTALDHLGVRGYPKTTGSRGIQVWIPVERGRYEYTDTSEWVHTLSRAVGATVPDLVSWEWTKSERGGRARLDYTQNASIKTLVAPYAVRPAPGAPISMPISWDELEDPQLRSDRWTIRNAMDRLRQVGDLFAGAQTNHQVLPTL